MLWSPFLTFNDKLLYQMSDPSSVPPIGICNNITVAPGKTVSPRASSTCSSVLQGHSVVLSDFLLPALIGKIGDGVWTKQKHEQTAPVSYGTLLYL